MDGIKSTKVELCQDLVYLFRFVAATWQYHHDGDHDAITIMIAHRMMCLGIDIDAELSFTTRETALRALFPLASPTVVYSADNARMLVLVLIASHLDYCNSILYQAAAVHLRDFSQC